jgi:hypothetical protein
MMETDYKGKVAGNIRQVPCLFDKYPYCPLAMYSSHEGTCLGQWFTRVSSYMVFFLIHSDTCQYSNDMSLVVHVVYYSLVTCYHS